MNQFCIAFTSLCVFILSKVVFSENVPPLRVLTVLRAPFVVRDDDGRLSGYLIDLLNELASIGKFNYTFEAIEQEALYESTPTVINELYRQQADFAIGDNLIRSANSYFVNYTEPYLVSDLGVLVRKSELTARNISTIEHLLQWKPAWRMRTLVRACAILLELNCEANSKRKSQLYWQKFSKTKVQTEKIYSLIYIKISN